MSSMGRRSTSRPSDDPIELSATRYCSVGGTLATGITEIHHRYVVRSKDADEVMGEAAVTGPFANPDKLGLDAGPAMFPS